MRTLIAVLVLGGLGGLFLLQKKDSHNQVVNSPSAVERPAASATPAAPVLHREPSEHNWMKRSLDRARDVTEQSRNRTRDGQNP